ncbi:MAG: AAA domain-containing protein [Haloarculaceae archaeon]
MSLLFEGAIQRFDPERATHHRPDPGAVDPGLEGALPVEGIVAYATSHADLAHPEREAWTCLPLHGPDDATLSGEFVAYADDTLRGEIVVYGTGDGYDWLDLEEFATTALSRRVRFWHSDYRPPDRPDYYESPVDDREPGRRTVDPDDLRAGLLEYVEGEREAERERNRRRARERTPASLARSGAGAIPSLDGLGDPEDGLYAFRVDPLPEGIEDRRSLDVRDEFGIYEGNEALLHAPDGRGPDAFPLRVTVEAVRGSRVRCDVAWEAVDSRGAAGSFLARGREGFALTELCNPVPYDRERAGVEAATESFGDVLAGRRPLTFADTAAAESEPMDPELNQEQGVAVEHALLADDLFCIHGPPGTGKTRTLVEVVRRAVDAGRDVLVCADSNQAVDNVVVGSSTADRADDRSLHAHAQHGSGEFTLRRQNARRSASSLVRDRYGSTDERPDVVAATNSSAAALSRTFDLVVVDEATQATFTATCIPLSKAEKAVLAGDHRQLPPFSSTEDPPDSAYGESLFEHVYAEGGVYEGVGVQLRTQYRMHRDVVYFPNRRFYDGSLRTGRDVPPLGGTAIEGFDIGGTEVGDGHSTANPWEAGLVVRLVERLRGDGVPPEGIGVITPYTAQSELLRSRLDPAVEVDTVDSFQGSEKTAVVLSLTRSNPQGEVGFLGRPADGPRRLNVALTRAKRYLAVVGDWSTLRADPPDGRAKTVDLYRALHSYLVDTGRMREVVREFVDPVR